LTLNRGAGGDLMKVVEVDDSSVILKVGYDGENLFVQFVDGHWYKYSRVPETVFERLCAADSKGQFINKEIKPIYKNYEPCIFNPDI